MLNFDFQARRNQAPAGMVEWNGIFRLFRFSGIVGQPREVHPKFRNEIPKNVCCIRSPTRNFRNFWSNGKRPKSPSQPGYSASRFKTHFKSISFQKCNLEETSNQLKGLSNRLLQCSFLRLSISHLSFSRLVPLVMFNTTSCRADFIKVDLWQGKLSKGRNLHRKV